MLQISMRKKLVLDNKTEWDNRAMRSVLLKVINENIKYEGPLRHGIHCKVVYARSRFFGGYAYYHSGTMRLKVPKPSDRCRHCGDGMTYRLIEDGKLAEPAPCEHCNGTGKSEKGMTLNVRLLAHLFEHELAHCRGYRHKGMCSLNSYRPKDDDYKYLDGMTIGVRIVKPKPKPDRRAIRLQRIELRLKRWEAKRKRAETAIKKLRASLKRAAKAREAANDR